MALKAGDIFIVKYRTKTPTAAHTGAAFTKQSPTISKKDHWAMYLVAKIGASNLCRVMLLAEQKPITAKDFMKVSQFMSDGVAADAPGAMPLVVGGTATKGISMLKLNKYLEDYMLDAVSDKVSTRPRFAYAFPVMSCKSLASSITSALGAKRA